MLIKVKIPYTNEKRKPFVIKKRKKRWEINFKFIEDFENDEKNYLNLKLICIKEKMNHNYKIEAFRNASLKNKNFKKLCDNV